MENIKSYINSNFKRLFILTSLIFLSLFLLMIRLKITHSFFYLFLVWNLFLAIIPYTITSYLKEQNQISRFTLFLWFIGWLLFLPNAPYIVTDLIHLQLSPMKIIWYDALTIISFATTGLLLFYFSLGDMKKLIEQNFNFTIPKYIEFGVLFLSSFGVYLGRFLRFNSWDIIKNPFLLFEEIFYILILPLEHFGAWLFILAFGLLLSTVHYIFDRLIPIHPHNPEGN